MSWLEAHAENFMAGGMLAEDLDAPTALREIDHWANATDFGARDEAGAGETIRALVDAALGVTL